MPSLPLLISGVFVYSGLVVFALALGLAAKRGDQWMRNGDVEGSHEFGLAA